MSKTMSGFLWCATPLSAGGLNLLPNFQKGVLAGLQLWEGVTGKEGVTFFRGGCNFYKKTKLKSEIFNGKKSL